MVEKNKSMPYGMMKCSLLLLLSEILCRVWGEVVKSVEIPEG